MKFSTTFTLARLALLSIGSEARIGRSLETVLPASESSPNAFPVYIALDIEKYPTDPCRDCKVGLLDQNGMPLSRIGLVDAGCVQVGVTDDGLINDPDSLSYFVENIFVENKYVDDFGKANCTDIGNKNRAKCGLTDVPENACVIVHF